MSHAFTIFDDSLILGYRLGRDLVASWNQVEDLDLEFILFDEISCRKISKADSNIVALIKNQNFSHQGATVSNLLALERGNKRLRL